MASDCPEPEKCRRCRKEGHKVDECPEPEKCFNCREEGHKVGHLLCQQPSSLDYFVDSDLILPSDRGLSRAREVPEVQGGRPPGVRVPQAHGVRPLWRRGPHGEGLHRGGEDSHLHQ